MGKRVVAKGIAWMLSCLFPTKNLHGGVFLLDQAAIGGLKYLPRQAISKITAKRCGRREGGMDDCDKSTIRYGVTPPVDADLRKPF
jgi:hypothetical protein